MGDGNVGKTHLIMSYATNKGHLDYVPPIFDSAVTVTIDGVPYILKLFDTSKQQERQRPLGYPETDVFLICFSVVVKTSFENVKQQWLPEIKQHCPNTPFLLVGLQTDLRDDNLIIENLAIFTNKPVNTEQGEQLAREHGAVKYMECSAVKQVSENNPLVHVRSQSLVHKAYIFMLSFPTIMNNRGPTCNLDIFDTTHKVCMTTVRLTKI